MKNKLNWLKARSIFYPTLTWNMLHGRWLKRRNWWDSISSEIILGALPFARDVPAMSAAGVKAVVNTCEEWSGPMAAYQQFGIVQFRMPTVDFTHPTIDSVIEAVEFIDQHATLGHTVYIHCKAGRARSATVAMCWLIKAKQMSAADAQSLLISKRPHVNPHVAQRPVVIEFERRFGQQTGH